MRYAVRLTLIAIAIGTIDAAAQQAPADVEAVLARIGERIGDYYRRAQNVMCVEKYVVQPLRTGSYGGDGLARSTEAELRIETTDADGDGGSGETKVLRVIRKINGRAPRPSDNDRKNTAGCTDPNPLSAEPLEFLLPNKRDEYAFTLGGRGKGKDRELLIVDFKSKPTRVKPELIEAENGKADCYGR